MASEKEKSIFFWILGTFCMFFGILIAGNVDPGALGASIESVGIAYVISFILILLGGMFWITVAVLQH